MSESKSTSVEMPMFGMGTWKLKGEECQKMVHEAIDAGYRLFDTAALYKNEEDISIGIKRSGVPRGEIFISSKVHDNDQKRNRVKQAVDEMLKRLDTDYLDTVLLHSALPDNYVDSWKVLKECQDAGKVRNIGVSNFRIPELKKLIDSTSVVPFINQGELHVFNTRMPWVNYCKEMGIKVQAFASLTAGWRLADEKFSPIRSSVADATDGDKAVVASLLKWSMNKGYYVIPKPDNREQMLQNIQVYKDWKSCKDVDPKHDEILDSLNEDWFTMRRYKD